MRFKLTLVLFVLNALAFLTIHYWTDEIGLGQETASGVTGWDSSEILAINRIEMSGALLDAPRILEKKNNQWVILSPVDWPANYFAVQRILTQLEFLNVEARFTVQDILQADQKLSDYGLEDPILVLTLFSGRNTVVLKIGAPTELGNRLYILGPDEKEVIVVNKDFLDSLVVDLIDLKNSQIFDIPLFEVNSITVQMNKPNALKVRLVKNDQQWKLEAPIQALADNARVESILAQLNAVSIDEFVDSSNLSLYGLVDPSVRVTIQGGTRRQTLLVGQPVSHDDALCYYAKLENSPMVFKLCSTVIEQLKDAQEILRDRTILVLDPQKINSVEIVQSEKSVILQKLENESWKVAAKNAGVASVSFNGDTKIIEGLIESFSNLEAVRFESDAPSLDDFKRLGFESPQRTIVFNNSQEKTIIFGGIDYTKKLLYAKRENSSHVYEVPLFLLDQTPLNALHYKNRLLEELPDTSRIFSLSLKNVISDKMLFAHELSKDQTWDEFLSKEPDTVRRPLEELLTSVRSFYVKDYLSDSYADSYRLDSDNEIKWEYLMEALVEVDGAENEKQKIKSWL